MKTKIIQIRIEEDLRDKLQKLAESNALTVSSQIRMLIKKGVEVG